MDDDDAQRLLSLQQQPLRDDVSDQSKAPLSSLQSAYRCFFQANNKDMRRPRPQVLR